MILSNITTLDYQKFINKIGETRALETISKTHTHIRTAVRTAINDGYISRDFTRNIELNYANPARSNEEKYLNYEDSITLDRKSTRLNSSHVAISYAVFCLKKKK